MGTGDHLGEINQNRFLVIINHDIELVEIAVDDTVISQFQHQIHQLFVNSAGVAQFS